MAACRHPDCSHAPSQLVSNYRYERLRNSKASFRLLQVIPDIDDQPIRVRLVEAELTQPGEYEAMSYAWQTGPAATSHHIHIEDSRLEVSETVHLALHLYRKRHDALPLWIDQICIEQAAGKESDAEKAGQLAIMRRIYEQATRTIIWLGQSTEEDAIFLGLIKSARVVREQMLPLVDETAQLLQSHGRPVNRPGIMAMHIMSDTQDLVSQGVTSAPSLKHLTEAQVTAVLAFFEKRWFTRLWPLQEVVVSGPKTVHLGAEWMSWDDVGFFVTWFIHNCDGLSIPKTLPRGIQAAAYFYHYGQEREKRHPLTTMLRVGRRFDATNKVDKIYAIAGLVDFGVDWTGQAYPATDLTEAGIPRGIPIAPTMNPGHLYEAVSKYLIRRDESLEVLTFVQTQEGAAMSEGSWVPDLSQPEVGQLIWLPDANAANFMASSGKADNVGFVQGHGLEVRGVLIGRVEHISAAIHSSDFTGDSLRRDWSRVLAWIGEAVSHRLRSRNPFKRLKSVDEKLVTSLALVLTAGRHGLGGRIVGSGEGARSFEAHAAQFCAFVKDIVSAIESAGLSPLSRRAFMKLLSFAEMHCPLADEDESQEYANGVFGAVRSRKIFWTDSGMLGLAPAASEYGDEVYVLQGGRIPFVVRDANTAHRKRSGLKGIPTSLHLIGGCFVAEAMNREFDGLCNDEGQKMVLC